MINYSDYIGLKYECRGRGPKYDCYGLCVKVYEEIDKILLRMEKNKFKSKPPIMIEE